jgi:hypothetical protein
VVRVVRGVSVHFSQEKERGLQQFTVKGAGAAELMDPIGRRYDAVILAHPLLSPAVSSSSNGDGDDVAPRAMKATHVSIVRGELNATTLVAAAVPRQSLLPTIITMTAGGRRFLGGIRSIGRLRGTTDHFKIFSDTALTADRLESELHVFMPGVTIRKAHLWTGAYPRYSLVEGDETPSPGLESSFVLSSGRDGEAPVYYAGALEAFVSTMETQCIGARNTALLVLQRWQRATKTAVKTEAELIDEL